MYDYKMSLDYIIKKARKAQRVIIVGASRSGKQLMRYLQNEKIDIEAFYDNNKELCGKDIEGIKIINPKNLKGIVKKAFYIIASVNYKDELERQLHEMGIQEEEIAIFYPEKSYQYYSDLEEAYYGAEIQDMYYRRFGHYLNLENPSTYNEKINWQKIYDKDERKTRLADKYLVREWVKETIGAKYLTHLYGAWDKAKDIDFSLLPKSCVFKLNHGAGWNIIVNGGGMDKERICEKLDAWRKLNFAYFSLEMHYKNIKPKIICEEYMENTHGELYDYKVFCFHGEPKYIMFLADRLTSGLKMAFYDTEWKKMPFVYSYPMYEKEVPRPGSLEEMLEMSRRLSKGFSHVRVDWYSLPPDRLVFGEMTFTSYSGFCEWNPKEYDQILGDLI